MMLKKIPRKDFESISREDFWYEEFDKSEELIYWRKKYEINIWFHENTVIDEECCSDEISKEKLELLVKWLKKEDFKDDAIKIKDFIKQTDFVNDVIFYKYSN